MSTKKSGLLPAPIPPNLRRKIGAEEKALACIYEHREKFNRVPGVNELQRFARCHKQVASRVLARFKRDSNRQIGQAKQLYLYMQDLIPTSYSFDSMKLKDMHELTEAEFALLRYCPEKAWLLTIICPSDSEIAYLALSKHSGDIPHKLVERLLKKLLKVSVGPLYAYRWEIMRYCYKLHCHILICISGSDVSDARKLLSNLRDCWHEILEELDDTTFCDPFRNDSGVDQRYDADWCHVSPWVEEHQQNFQFSYLAKQKKNQLFQREAREVEVLHGTKIGLTSLFGISPALIKLKKTSMIKQAISYHERREDANLIVNEIVAKVSPLRLHEWKPYGAVFPIGKKCRIGREQFESVKSVCLMIAEREMRKPIQSFANQFAVNYTLSPAGYLSVYVGSAGRLNRHMTDCSLSKMNVFSKKS